MNGLGRARWLGRSLGPAHGVRRERGRVESRESRRLPVYAWRASALLSRAGSGSSLHLALRERLRDLEQVTATRALALCFLLGSTGCYDDSLYDELLAANDALSTETGTDSEASGATASASITITDGASSEDSGTDGQGATGSTTGDVSASGTGSGETEAPPTTSAGDDTPPAIVDLELTPETIKHNGSIAASITASDADGVRMKLDDGEALELDELGPGEFGGEILALTGLDNGEHTALFTPWRGDLVGAGVEATYTLDLPTPGSQIFWESGDTIGEGSVVALGVLPSGHIVELGTRKVNGSSRCYLRRRDQTGAWAPADLVEVLPGTSCEAVDLVVTAEGSIFVLVNREGNDGLRWWLGEASAWGGIVKNRGLGAKDEVAVKLAASASESVAVCGNVPTGESDEIDAAAWIFNKELPGEAWVWRYVLDPNFQHDFGETVADCAWDDERLVLVGEAIGLHKLGEPIRARLFILEYDTATNDEVWRIDTGGGPAQSGAVAVCIDRKGRHVVAGYTCGDACSPSGDLRVYDPDGGIISKIPLGSWISKEWGVHAMAWSPAGYTVVTSGGLAGSETAFTVRAFSQSSATPLWTFTRADAQAWHMAFALTLGPWGEVYAGGFGDTAFPAVAYVGG